MYVVGQYPSNTTLYHSDGTAWGTLAWVAGARDSFLVKYDADGFVQWATKQSGAAGETAFGVATDASSNIYVAGSYGNGLLSVYNQSGTVAFTRATSGLTSIFLVKYDTTGVASWASNCLATGNAEGYKVKVDSQSNVYVCGYFNGTLTISSGAGVTWGTRVATAGQDAILIKYNTSGSVQWASRAGTAGSDAQIGRAHV